MSSIARSLSADNEITQQADNEESNALNDKLPYKECGSISNTAAAKFESSAVDAKTTPISASNLLYNNLFWSNVIAQNWRQQLQLFSTQNDRKHRGNEPLDCHVNSVAKGLFVPSGCPTNDKTIQTSMFNEQIAAESESCGAAECTPNAHSVTERKEVADVNFVNTISSNRQNIAAMVKMPTVNLQNFLVYYSLLRQNLQNKITQQQQEQKQQEKQNQQQKEQHMLWDVLMRLNSANTQTVMSAAISQQAKSSTAIASARETAPLVAQLEKFDANQQNSSSWKRGYGRCGVKFSHTIENICEHLKNRNRRTRVDTNITNIHSDTVIERNAEPATYHLQQQNTAEAFKNRSKRKQPNDDEQRSKNEKCNLRSRELWKKWKMETPLCETFATLPVNSTNACSSRSADLRENANKNDVDAVVSTRIVVADGSENSSSGFECARCGKMFSYAYYRDKHLKYTRCVDNGDRKFPCSFCARSFEKRDRLRIHVLHVHENHRPHVCQTCGKAFSQSSSLNKHLRVHSGERPYQCPFCTKCFTASSILRTHIRQHSGEKPFKCIFCGKSFASHAAHDSHVRRTHNQN